ncbi:hypothetical protein [Pseudolysinimonas yzui]|uniref:Uncharacterized protein n=1 Tax=Pseudolysinimonas yzui TaxID=2708254 RepID=A0A8J3GRS4_9MICO|nr:hypothetical protein [Pseudolysinimonas yzui]GHF20995.1 hypothetical protein GCM10011600_22550 [Pseudolysinimonas yzui]
MAQAKDDSAQPTPADEVPEEIVVEEDEIVVEEAPTTESATATATLTDEKVESPLAGERVVYVSTPTPPKPHSNRIVGSLLALAGTLVFAVGYGLVGAAYIALTGSTLGFGDFITDAIFWIPVLFFTIGFVLVAVLVNRAAWWVHVLSSLLVAFITYFGSIGMLLLVHQIAGSSVGFIATAFSPFVIAATIVAREVSIWVGLLISRRGTRLTARNRAEREAFDAEQKASDGATAPAA